MACAPICSGIKGKPRGSGLLSETRAFIRKVPPMYGGCVIGDVKKVNKLNRLSSLFSEEKWD